MNTFSTLGDVINALAGILPQASVTKPTSEELNTGDSVLFVPPSSLAIDALRRQLSYEDWLWLLEVNAIEQPAHNQMVENRKALQYLARLAALLNFKPESNFTSAANARIRWAHYQVLDPDGDETAKPYYRLMAETTAAQVRKRAGYAVLWDALSPEERGERLRQRWGDLPLSMLEAQEQQAISRQAEKEAAVVVAPSKAWELSTQHPGFGPWLVNELLSRPVAEIDAYLTVMWRVGAARSSSAPGDVRRLIAYEEVSSIMETFEFAINDDATASEQRILKRAKKWFQQCAILLPDKAESPASTTQTNLSLRQLALREFYKAKPIRSDERALKLVQEVGLNSVELLVKQYRKISRQDGITGIHSGGVKHMIADLLVVKPLLDKDKIYKLDIHLRMLQNRNLRTGPD